MKNVYWLTGDFHLAAVSYVNADLKYGMHEIQMGPGGAIAPLFGTLGLNPPQFSYGRGNALMAADTVTVVDLDPTVDPPTFHVKFYDLDGSVHHDEVLTD